MTKARTALVAGSLTLLGLTAGAGLASAEPVAQDPAPQPVPCAFESQQNLPSRPECRAQVLGFGSAGTESASNAFQGGLNAASLALSIQLPAVTGLGSLPGSTGSTEDTPWFSLAQTSVGSLSGSVGNAFE